MSKDLKIGMIIGVVLLIAATLMISFLSEGSLMYRLKDKFKKETAAPLPGDDKNENKTPPPLPADTPPEDGGKIHIVANGETINKIAEKYYDNPDMINKIVDENPHIPDNYELKAGMRLIIPE